MIPLPIDSVIADLVARVREKRSAVVVAPPGAGKTTRVPPAILGASLLDPEHPNLLMLQPRRVAARAVAQRIADEREWKLGQEVGYIIRFENRTTPNTRLRVMTEGILTRQIVEDPFLTGVGAVILDEFHERSIHTDLAIAMLKEIRSTVRPDVVIIVMSATLEAEPVSQFLDAPIIRSEGRCFAVDISHRSTANREVPDKIAGIVDETQGDTLVFLPGVEEIRRTTTALNGRQELLVLPLHGSLSNEDQILALRPAPAGKRKIVLATNIAETSLTIDGIQTVIDSGLARVAGFDPFRGMDRLELKRISKASATQRAGRAGRTGPGACIRLYSATEEREMNDFELPEIRRVDLSSTLLSIHELGHPDPRKFGWYEAPDEHAMQAAERLLEMLGALHAGKMTRIGEQLLSLPVHPRIGRLLIEAAQAGMVEEGATVAALLSERDILRAQNVPARERHATHRAESDLLVRMELLHRAEQSRFDDRLRDEGIDLGACRQVIRVRDELTRTARRISIKKGPTPSDPDAELQKFALLAYPDRVCRRRGSGQSAAVMVGGGGVKLAAESAVHDPEFFVALDVRQDERSITKEALVRIASGIEAPWLEELFPYAIARQRVLTYDANRQRVVAKGVTRYHDLVIKEDADAPVDPEQAGRVLAEALAPRARELFESDEASKTLLNRLALLREHMPEHPWPTFGDEELSEALAEAATNKRSLDDLRAIGLVNILRSKLVYPLDRLLDQHAPETVEVPSGSKIRLNYESGGKPPILAVRLQELFGLLDTPRIAGNRVPILIHLLAPNFRPVQVTSDLRSFWSTTYFQVRKDLRVRYPKHSWPEDPLTAKPEAKGSRRRG